MFRRKLYKSVRLCKLPFHSNYAQSVKSQQKNHILGNNQTSDEIARQNIHSYYSLHLPFYHKYRSSLNLHMPLLVA